MISMIGTDFYFKKSIWLFMFIILVSGCIHVSGQRKEVPIKIERIVILGMRPVMSPGTKPGVIRIPFSESVFMSEPVPQNIAENMTKKLYEKVLDMTVCGNTFGSK